MRIRGGGAFPTLNSQCLSSSLICAVLATWGEIKAMKWTDWCQFGLYKEVETLAKSQPNQDCSQTFYLARE
jgi:hypothetical protein